MKAGNVRGVARQRVDKPIAAAYALQEDVVSRDVQEADIVSGCHACPFELSPQVPGAACTLPRPL